MGAVFFNVDRMRYPDGVTAEELLDDYVALCTGEDVDCCDTCAEQSETKALVYRSTILSLLEKGNF